MRRQRSITILKKWGKTGINKRTGFTKSFIQKFLVKDSGLAEQSANSYAFAVRMALREAVRKNILLSDPSDGIKGVSVSDPDREYL